MFKDKKVIIFDLDGTLIDSLGVWNATDEQLIKELSGDTNFEIDNIHDFRSTILSTYNQGDIYLNYCAHLKEICGSNLSAEEIKNLRWQISTEFFKHLNYKPKAAKVLQLLKDYGFTLVLATTGTRAFVDICRNENENIKKAANFDDIFSYVITRDDVTHSKPNPEIHLKVMQDLKVSPQECLVVEDSLMGIQAAIGAGIESVSIYDKYSDSDRALINKIATYKADSFDEMLKQLENEADGLGKKYN